MKRVKCVEIAPQSRPILHRKTGTISVANLQRRKLLFASIVNLDADMSCVESPKPSKTKRVRWASPIETVHRIVVPFIKTKRIEPKMVKMVTIKLERVDETMDSAEKAVKQEQIDTENYCSECEQQYSSPSKLNRHKTTQKHQRNRSGQTGGQSTGAPPGPSNATITKPTEVAEFYCSACDKQYSKQSKLNRHQKTSKHEQDLYFSQLRQRRQE